MAQTNNMLAFLPDLLEYLMEKEGYQISTGTLHDFLILADSMGEELSYDTIEALLRPLVVKTEKQDTLFHSQFHAFFQVNEERKRARAEAIQRSRERASAAQQLQQEQAARKEKAERKLGAFREKEVQLKSQLTSTKHSLLPYLSESEYTKAKKDKCYPEYAKMVRKYAKKQRDFLLNMDECAAGRKKFLKKQVEEAIPELQNLLKMCILCADAKGMMIYIDGRIKLAKKMMSPQKTDTQKVNEQLNTLYSQMKHKEQEIEDAERAMQQARKEERQAEKETQHPLPSQAQIHKRESINHRAEFINGRNAVSASSAGEPDWMGKDLTQLTPAEKLQIKNYIHENAREFRTRMSGSIRVSAKRKIDFAETCKQACRTNGIPLKLCYRKPLKKKTKLLLMLDISGSCSSASELMLTFMYYMQECFSGGCMTYVFVDSLYDVSQIFQDADDPDEAIRTIRSIVPTRGVYSNYYTTLQEFYETQMPKLNSSYTFSFFIGDARNNRNPTGEEYVKAISRKSKDAYWLNTDDPKKWGQGDSVIWSYAPYMRECVAIATPGDLLRFIADFRRGG